MLFWKLHKGYPELFVPEETIWEEGANEVGK
jgi:hypothetical protein